MWPKTCANTNHKANSYSVIYQVMVKWAVDMVVVRWAEQKPLIIKFTFYVFIIQFWFYIFMVMLSHLLLMVRIMWVDALAIGPDPKVRILYSYVWLCVLGLEFYSIFDLANILKFSYISITDNTVSKAKVILHHIIMQITEFIT